MNGKPECIGKFLKINNRDCGKCNYRLECYELFRKYEKEEEKLKTILNKEWFDRPACEWMEKMGICTTCG